MEAGRRNGGSWHLTEAKTRARFDHSRSARWSVGAVPLSLALEDEERSARLEHLEHLEAWRERGYPLEPSQ
jgi:hypothetical protein